MYTARLRYKITDLSGCGEVGWSEAVDIGKCLKIFQKVDWNTKTDVYCKASLIAARREKKMRFMPCWNLDGSLTKYSR